MQTCKIFIVDRNPVHNSLIKYHLNINKFNQVQGFPSGQECLYRMERNAAPDFIITDYDIGNYSGFDFLRKIRERFPETRVVYFSSLADPVLAMKLLDAGASDFIVKTSKLESGIIELLKNIRYVLKVASLI